MLVCMPDCQGCHRAPSWEEGLEVLCLCDNRDSGGLRALPLTSRRKPHDSPPPTSHTTTALGWPPDCPHCPLQGLLQGNSPPVAGEA